MYYNCTSLVGKGGIVLLHQRGRRERGSRCGCRCRCRREAAEHNFGYGGRLVDESMIVLRKRIHEMKMIERNYEAPSDWMEWEKRYYTAYDSFICQSLGFLQTQLMNTRPAVALALFSLLALSLPTSAALVFFHFLHPLPLPLP